MTKKNLTGILIILGIVALVAFGAAAFAGWGMGYVHHGWGYHHGYGPHHWGWGDRGYDGPMSGYSEDQYKEMETEQTTFLSQTEDIRRNLYSKSMELESEMAENNPDPKKASELQNEISKLQAQMDQKQIDHMIRMRKFVPNESMYRDDYGRGYCR